MNKIINYPIKYAVLELKKRGGWAVDFEDVTQGFIVSKCYVVESNIVYNADGTNSVKHKVVFPYDDISLFEIAKSKSKETLNQEDIEYILSKLNIE